MNSIDNFSAELLDEAAVKAQDLLRKFATDEDFVTKIALAFGDGFDGGKVEDLRQQWLAGEFESFPVIEIRPAAEINGANGAFSADTNRIYLSQEYVARNASNIQAISDVLLEEFGHFVDAQINLLDAAGDEGEIFSAVVSGVGLDEGTIQRLKGEDDRASIALDGQVIQIEQAEGFNIEFDYTYDTGFFKNSREHRDALDAAASFWEKVINKLGDEFEDVPSKTKVTFKNPSTGESIEHELKSNVDDILIFAGARTNLKETTGGDAVGVFGVPILEEDKRQKRIIGRDFEPFVGTLSFDTDRTYDSVTIGHRCVTPKVLFLRSNFFVASHTLQEKMCQLRKS